MTQENKKGRFSESEQPIRFAGSVLGEKRHICAFFHNADDEYRLLLPFIKEGFERGEKAFHVVNPKLRDEHLRRLESAGIDVTNAERVGQFELCDWEEVYLREATSIRTECSPGGKRCSNEPRSAAFL